MTTPRRVRADDGFTLVELLIALGIGVTLTAAMGAVLVLGLGTTDEAATQVQEAAWAQVVGAFFLADVHGAEAASASTFGCYEPDDVPVGGSLAHRFEWTEPDDWDPPEPEDDEDPVPPPPRTKVDWWVDGGEESLMRTRCVVVTEVEIVDDEPVEVEEITQVEATVVARETADVVVECQPLAGTCEISWTAAEADVGADEGRHRTYTLRVLRRVP